MAEEQNVYEGVYRLLMAGVVVTNLLFVIGLILALIHPQYVPLSARWARDQYQWSTLIHGLASGEADAFLTIGTLLLILTPIARVVVSIYSFYVDHDRKYVAVTSIVLLVILLTLVLGALGVP